MAYTTPRTWTAGETLTAALLNQELRNILQALFPVGIYAYIVRAATTGETLFSGVWLECNGVAVLRADYPALNTLLSGLGYPFGPGNGTTTFNLPPADGRTLVSMASGGHADVNALGDSDGLAKAARSPKHNSSSSLSASNASAGTPAGSISAHSVNDPGHFHSTGDGGGTAGVAGGGIVVADSDGSNTDTKTTGITIGNHTFTGSALGTHGHSISGSVGPGGTRPDDTPAYLVGGTLFVKAFA